MGTYEDIVEILNYLADEEKHFEESGKPKDHIWMTRERVREWLESPSCPLTDKEEQCSCGPDITCVCNEEDPDRPEYI